MSRLQCQKGRLPLPKTLMDRKQYKTMLTASDSKTWKPVRDKVTAPTSGVTLSDDSLFKPFMGIEAYLNHYRATGDERCLKAMTAAWTMLVENWQHVAGAGCGYNHGEKKGE